MDWSQFQDVDGEAAAVDGVEAMVADGTHHPKIGWVKVQAKDWAKSPTNKSGMVLTVRLDFGRGIKSVFHDIRCDYQGAIQALCRSARVHPPAGSQWDEQQLKDKIVTVETTLSINPKTAREYIKVVLKPNADPLPVSDESASPARANRTPTQKADAAASMPSDDIPF